MAGAALGTTSNQASITAESALIPTTHCSGSRPSPVQSPEGRLGGDKVQQAKEIKETVTKVAVLAGQDKALRLAGGPSYRDYC